MHDSDIIHLDGGSLTTGRCICNRVEFEINQPEIATGFCHCKICQRFSGPVNAWTAFPSGSVRFVRDKPRYFESSPIAKRGFCSNCGTSLTYQLMAPEPCESIVIHTVALDNPEDFAPSYHGGTESQLPWLKVRDSLSRIKCEESATLRQAWSSVGIPDPKDWKGHG